MTYTEPNTSAACETPPKDLIIEPERIGKIQAIRRAELKTKLVAVDRTDALNNSAG
ncbi:hypothetical protein AWB64_05575 [Caballeronia sordidicola]|uniref:Uncharacterized protein n=1 Tax=Caballeronia sordidicola TaxID=196367 RepID=A0A158I5W9_CABSO|nr:hypothetical protein AWB64_05575 [Caballeronia sordidicola]